MSRPGHRDQRAVVRDAVLGFGLRRRHLVVALEHQLLVDDVENGVGAPVRQVGRAAAGPRAAAPLVGEEDLGAVVVERRRVPVGEVLVGGVVQPLRVHGIRDVHQDAVARAGAGGQADFGEHGDVVALVGLAGALRVRAMIAALPQAGDVARSSAKMRGRLTIFAVCGAASGTSITSMLKSAVFCPCLARGSSSPRAPRRPARCRCPSRRRRCGDLSRASGTSVWVCEPRQVWTAATWRGFFMSRDVEDPHAAEAFLADGLGDALDAAVDAAARLLHRHEQQVAVDRDVALAAGAGDGGEQLRPARVLDVVGVEAVEVADPHVGAGEREVRVGEVEAAAAERRASTGRAGRGRGSRSGRGRRRRGGGSGGARSRGGASSGRSLGGCGA